MTCYLSRESLDPEGRELLPLANLGTCYVFEEPIRKFSKESNEEGEHWASRDAVQLMAKRIFLPGANEIEFGVYLLYDGACGASSGSSHLKQDGKDKSLFPRRQVASP